MLGPLPHLIHQQTLLHYQAASYLECTPSHRQYTGAHWGECSYNQARVTSTAYTQINLQQTSMRMEEPFRGQTSAGSVQLPLKEELQASRMRQQSHMLHMAVQPWLTRTVTSMPGPH